MSVWSSQYYHNRVYFYTDIIENFRFKEKVSNIELFEIETTRMFTLKEQYILRFLIHWDSKDNKIIKILQDDGRCQNNTILPENRSQFLYIRNTYFKKEKLILFNKIILIKTIFNCDV